MTPGSERPSVSIDGDVFARLVGSYPETDTLLFEVARLHLDRAEGEWSEPVQFRFVHRRGAIAYLELREAKEPA